MAPIDRTLIAEILSIQDHAYRLLLWLGDQARDDPELLSLEAEGALCDSRTCLAWLEERKDTVPAAHRCPGRERELAALLSSFLRTSFHVKRFEWEGRIVQAELRTGPSHEGARASKRVRHGGSLTHEALHRLCRDEGIRLSSKALARVARAQTIRADLHVWCYAVGLVHRAQGRGEGESDWEHWRSIPLAERKNLSVDAVWAARARLHLHLKTVAETQVASESRR
jgi:hypothetical protein